MSNRKPSSLSIIYTIIGGIFAVIVMVIIGKHVIDNIHEQRRQEAIRKQQEAIANTISIEISQVRRIINITRDDVEALDEKYDAQFKKEDPFGGENLAAWDTERATSHLKGYPWSKEYKNREGDMAKGYMNGILDKTNPSNVQDMDYYLKDVIQQIGSVKTFTLNFRGGPNTLYQYYGSDARPQEVIDYCNEKAAILDSGINQIAQISTDFRYKISQIKITP